MIYDSGTAIGIGGVPVYLLDVLGAARLGRGVTQAALSSTDILSTAHTTLAGTGANYLSIGQYPAGTNNFGQWIQSSFSNPTSATYNLILQPLGGNVGVGIANPIFKLDVSGTGRFSGQLTIGSTITNGTYAYTLPGSNRNTCFN